MAQRTRQALRIVMCGPNPDGQGGVASVVRTVLAEPAMIEAKVEYVITHRDGSFGRKLITALAAYMTLMKKAFQGIDLIHVHGASRASVWRKSGVVLLSRLFRIPLIYHIHGAEFEVFYHQECGPFRKWLVRSLLTSADAIIALSDQWTRSLSAITDGRVPVHQVFNPVALPLASTVNRNCIVVDDHPVRFIMMGRLGQRKGVYDLLAAAAQLNQSGLCFQLLLCGDGDVDKVRDLVNELNLTQCVDVPGWVDPVTAKLKLRAADCFVMPSYHEGLPVAILEAAAYGLAIITTPVGGIPDVIQHGQTGLVVQPGAVSELAQAMEYMIHSDVDRTRLGNAARDFVGKHCAAEKIVEDIFNVYRSVLPNMNSDCLGMSLKRGQSKDCCASNISQS
jgi:glycosyltransferase involved in cell wall biosynthesis